MVVRMRRKRDPCSLLADVETETPIPDVNLAISDVCPLTQGPLGNSLVSPKGGTNEKLHGGGVCGHREIEAETSKYNIPDVPL